jgi:hypothetical protein
MGQCSRMSLDASRESRREQNFPYGLCEDRE